MNRIIFTLAILLSVFSQTAISQQLTVMSFIEDTSDLTARTLEGRRLDANGNPCALLKVILLKSEASFSSPDLVEASGHKVNQYWVYLVNGAKFLDVDVPGFLPLKLRFSNCNPDITSLKGETTYLLTISSAESKPTDEIAIASPLAYPRTIGNIQSSESAPSTTNPAQLPIPKQANSVSFYAQAGYQVGNISGLGFNIGCNLYRVNLEGDLTIGLTDYSEEFHSIIYKPTRIAIKAGYEFCLSAYFRLTPQIGVGAVCASGTQSGNVDLDFYAIPAAISLRTEYRINDHFGISLTPEYCIKLSESETFGILADQSSTIQGFGTGFNTRLGVNFCF